MPFNSLSFLLFFPLVVLLYFVLPHRTRWMLLLSAGVVFYMWVVPAYLPVAAVIISAAYFSGRWMEKRPEGRKGAVLVFGLLMVLLILIVFKYTYFISENLARAAAVLHLDYPVSMPKWILPLGISFQSFMALAYIIEVYRGNIKAERHFGIFSLYLLFFPVAASGPIERPQHLLPQFREKHVFDIPRISSGLRLMIWGFFKKLVIADRLAVFVNIVYKDADSYQGFPLWWATFFFALQIYCDFSAYTDIARGTARILGFRITENFETPYFSASVTEFWRRWHITLSSWLRDYIFTPLSLNFRNMGKSGLVLALLITFTLCGIWHDAGWTFVIWGALHGLAMVVELLFSGKKRKKTVSVGARIMRVFKVFLTFVFLCLTWVLFRAGDLSAALHVYSGMMHPDPDVLIGVPVVTTFSFIMILFFAAVLILSDALIRSGLIQKYGKHRILRYIFVYVCLMMILIFGIFEQTDFVYTQF